MYEKIYDTTILRKSKGMLDESKQRKQEGKEAICGHSVYFNSLAKDKK